MATTSTITTPKQFVPIGNVQPDGRVLPSAEFIRFLFDIIRRIGGDGSSVSIEGLLAAVTQAEADIDALVLDVRRLDAEPDIVLFEEQDAGVEFIPGPPGPKGEQGAPGPAIFLLEDPVETETFWRV